MDDHVRMVPVARRGLPAGGQSIRIEAMDDINLVPTLRQLIGETMHKDPVPS
jgi:hypothetical protein